MASSGVILWLALLASCSAGPLGPLPNVTSVHLGLKEGSCALGDVVYLPGDEFPGASPCERCSCVAGGVQCTQQRCEPRPGCKAVHRPDHCCPTYQCECEQEGRVYDNGEKLVDPVDPCKVCYCQGGEVVCRRIACFVRDDCKPRLVPGRCCPEYDNCPLRGVTTLPGQSQLVPSTSAVENINSSVMPSSPNEHIKQEITIKEITPVSEIPVITDVKIKEILPSPAMEIAEYSSSKSPLITREATSEKNLNESTDKTDAPPIIEPSISSASSELPSASSNHSDEIKTSNDPSKISLSTQDSISSEMYPPILTSIATMGAGSIIPDVIPVFLTTKPPPIEDEDLSVIDHNPLFPPIPDDLTVSSNHEDEIVQQEQNLDSEHISDMHETVSVSSLKTPSTEAPLIKELLTTTMHYITDSLSVAPQDLSSDISTSKQNTLSTESSDVTSSRENTMLNLRSAIPTEILNVPSFMAESITEEAEESTEMPVTDSSDSSPEIIIGPETVDIREEEIDAPVINIEKDFISSTETDIPYSDSTYKPEDDVTSSHESQEPTTNFISKSNVATEITSHTELSSIPIETSDENPHDASEKMAKDKNSTSTLDPALSDASSTTKLLPTTSEEIVVSEVDAPENKDHSLENGETTEFILNSFGSSESATEPVELINISSGKEKSSAIIEPSKGRNNNVLTDLINLVGDVASISDHTESSEIEPHTTGRTTISDSEELLPVNSGYKSKNNNRNQNSITEVPFKNKTPVGNKQKVVEIEDDDTDSITDSPPPHDKIEPTTRRPIIDNVSDDVPINKTENIGKKDIEIITQSYVPTINRRPTKVVMKKSNEKPVSEAEMTENSLKISTESTINLLRETTVAPMFNESYSEVEDRIVGDAGFTETPAE